mmetsp:Transcript_102478/g.295027  ORF Transcript_102478/g.295027 Transcript_102478/m.295027 type:complete len:321 (+) Transcript_102478:36-998(+)
MAKRRRANGGGTSGAAAPACYVWFIMAVPVVALLYARSLPPSQERGDDGAAPPELEAVTREHEHLDMVRNALFAGKDSHFVFDEESNRWRHAGGQSGFASAEYWDATYKKSYQPYDWYGTWGEGIAGVPNSALRDLVEPSLAGGRDTSILNLGCGSSRLSEEMHDDGYWNITNVDISNAVIEKMRMRNAHRKPPMSWLTMDISSMSFPSDSFDLVIEKGTFDALYAGASNVIPKAVDEAWRVIRPGGYFMSVTFGDVRSRSQLFQPPSFPGWVSRDTRRIAKASGGSGGGGNCSFGGCLSCCCCCGGCCGGCSSCCGRRA